MGVRERKTTGLARMRGGLFRWSLAVLIAFCMAQFAAFVHLMVCPHGMVSGSAPSGHDPSAPSGHGSHEAGGGAPLTIEDDASPELPCHAPPRFPVPGSSGGSGTSGEDSCPICFALHQAAEVRAADSAAILAHSLPGAPLTPLLGSTPIQERLYLLSPSNSPPLSSTIS